MAYGIPPLLPGPLATRVPSATWSRYKRVDAPDTLFIFRSGRWDERAHGGTLGFWTADFKLEALWSRRHLYSEKIIGGRWGAVCVPDFSLWRGEPMAVSLYQLYRSRLLAVTWQAAGVPILPCLQWCDQRTLEICLDGIPRCCPVLGVQVRTVDSAVRDRFCVQLLESIAEIKPGAVLAYGRPRWFLDWIEREQIGWLIKPVGSPTDAMREAKNGS